MSRVVYPGSFDPVTNGHMNIIERCAQRFEQVIVAVLMNLEKDPLFPAEERLDMLRQCCAHLPNVEVDGFSGLLVDYVRRRQADFIVKGLRAISDFEFELQQALMNRRLAPEVDTIFMMTDADYSFLSSRIIKEIVRLGGKVDSLVPAVVEQRLRERLRSEG